MIVQCPHCGNPVDLGRVTGRKPLDITVKNICDALHEHGTVTATANELGCSRGYIYKVLKDNGLKAKQNIQDCLISVVGEYKVVKESGKKQTG